jgi:CubicO group peptidase (beta-lactamase class C family)
MISFALLQSLLTAPDLDVQKLNLAHQHLRSHIRAGRVPGAVTLVLQNGKEAHFGAAGWADLEGRRPMRRDTLFQVMSMTKPVTAAAAMIAIEQGVFSLDDPIERHLPQYRDQKVRLADGSLVAAKSRPTIRQLMTHTSGVSSDDPGGISDAQKFGLTLADYSRLLGQDPLLSHPGEEIRYSGVGFSTLAAIIEKRSGLPFQEFVSRHLLQPLGMKDTFFFLPARLRPRLSKVYTESKGKLTKFEPDARFRSGARFANGAGGLYSTASDMAKFIEAFREGSKSQILSAPARRLMTTIQTGALLSDRSDARGYGLGWSVVRSTGGQGTLRSVGSFGHTGAFGTEFWHDPSSGVTLVYLAQTFFVDESPRREFSTMVNASLR